MAYVLVIITALIWASSATVSKVLVNDINPHTIIVYTGSVGLIFNFLIILFQKKFKQLFKFTMIDHFRFLIMSILGYVIYISLMYLSIERMSAQLSFSINYLWPIMVVICSMLILKDKFSWIKLLSILMAFFSVFIIVTKGDFNQINEVDVVGLVYGILSSFSYGLFSALSKKYKYDTFLSSFFFVFYALIFNTIKYLFIGQPYVPGIFDILAFIWLGSFVGTVATILWLKALEMGDTAKVSNLIYITPFLSLFYTYFFLGEQIHVSMVVGLIMLVSSVLIQSKFDVKEKRNE